MDLILPADFGVSCVLARLSRKEDPARVVPRQGLTWLHILIRIHEESRYASDTGVEAPGHTCATHVGS